VLLDAAVRTGRPPAVVARGLGGTERREHGDDPSIGSEFVSWSRADSDRTLGVVEFAIFPHLDHERFPENSMASAEKWAASMPVPSYAIDDQTAIKVTDDSVEVVSEGHWRLFTP
jgi:dipeptidase E